MRQILTRSAQKAAALNSNKSVAGSLDSTPSKVTRKQIQKPSASKIVASPLQQQKTKANGNKPKQNLLVVAETTKQQTTRSQSKLQAANLLSQGIELQLSESKSNLLATPTKQKRQESFSRVTTPSRKAENRPSDVVVTNINDSQLETKIAKLKTEYNTEQLVSIKNIATREQSNKVELAAHSASANTLDESISFDPHTPVQTGLPVVPQYKSDLIITEPKSTEVPDSVLTTGLTSEFVSGTQKNFESIHPEPAVSEPLKISQIEKPTRQHPPQITQDVVMSRSPFDSLGSADCSELWTRSQGQSFDLFQEKIDNRVRNKEIAYSNFTMKQTQLMKYVSQNEFKKMQNQVSLGLVYYDPHFDFRPGFDPLMNNLNRFLAQPAPCQLPFYNQCEVRYYPRCGSVHHGQR